MFASLHVGVLVIVGLCAALGFFLGRNYACRRLKYYSLDFQKTSGSGKALKFYKHGNLISKLFFYSLQRVGYNSAVQFHQAALEALRRRIRFAEAEHYALFVDFQQPLGKAQPDDREDLLDKIRNLENESNNLEDDLEVLVTLQPPFVQHGNVIQFRSQ
jgi:hypothetical protein